MSSTELLNVEPQELRFAFELRKQISCSLTATNKTDNNVAFKVKTTNPKKYCVRPNTGVILPHSTCDIVVTMQAQKEAPPDMQCKDKFLIQSVVAGPDASSKEITPEMFNKEQTKVEDCRLKVLYVAPRQPPSPVAEGPEEGFSPRTTVVKNGSEANKMLADSHDKSPEEELLKHQSNKSGGVSITLIIVIGVLGVVIGYFVKRP